MDHIDETLTNNSLDPKFELSICAALRISPRKHSISTIMPQINQKYITLLWVCVSLLHHMVHIIIACLVFQSYILATNSNTLSTLVGSQIGSRLQKRLSEQNLRNYMLR
jgi:hypothetical protein